MGQAAAVFKKGNCLFLGQPLTDIPAAGRGTFARLSHRKPLVGTNHEEEGSVAGSTQQREKESTNQVGKEEEK